MQLGKEMLGRRHVLEGVEHAIHDVQVEGTFPVGLGVSLEVEKMLIVLRYRMGMCQVGKNRV
jgi:hypothetical protein